MIGQRKTQGQAPSERVFLAVIAWRGGLHEARSTRLEAWGKRPFSEERQQLMQKAREQRSEALTAFRQVKRLGDECASGKTR